MKKQSVIKQTLGVLGTHLLISIMMLIILMGILSIPDNLAWLRIIISVIAALIYAFMMFSSAYECASDDLKTFSQLKPYAYKGATLSSATVVLIIVLWVLHAVLWKIAPITDSSISPMTLIANGGCLLMTAPFLTFVDLKGPDCNVWGQIISVLVPLAACMFGYYCGYRKWDYVKYINRFVYEKKNKRK